MIQEAIEKTFVGGQKLPDSLADVCRFLDQNGYPLSGCFELSTIGMDDIRHWFKNNLESVKSILPFGRGASGELYCIWLTEGLPVSHAPIVMFGSEGSLRVLAADSLDFCKLLCLGYSELGLDDHRTPGEDFDETAPLREFLVGIHAFALPKSGESIIEHAVSLFPGFRAWVELHE